MNKPRILIIENSVAVTGAFKSILRSSQGLSDRFEFVFLFPQQSSVVSTVRAMGFEAYEVPMQEVRKNTLSIIRYLPALLYNTRRLSGLVKQARIDLMVVNDFYNLLPPVYKMFGGNLPYVCYVRFLPSKFPAVLVKTWSALHNRYAEITVAVSEAVKRELTIKKNVVVIGNELPHEDSAPMPNPDSATILYPANYIRGKGHEYALQSWAMIAKNHPQWKLRFVGGDMSLKKNKEFKTELVEMCNKLQLKDSVEWSDFSERISDEYLAASFVLNFSESESFSMTCLEAMFYGRPVIATRSGGPSEIIDQNESGILVNLRDTSAMADAIDYLIRNPLAREQMARLAYARVREKFSFENTISKLGEVYQEALRKL
jgi:L-malate glycosyltransferase